MTSQAPIIDRSPGTSRQGAGEGSPKAPSSPSPAPIAELDVVERVAPHSIHDVIAEGGRP